MRDITFIILGLLVFLLIWRLMDIKNLVERMEYNRYMLSETKDNYLKGKITPENLKLASDMLNENYDYYKFELSITVGIVGLIMMILIIACL